MTLDPDPRYVEPDPEPVWRPGLRLRLAWFGLRLCGRLRFERGARWFAGLVWDLS